MTTLYYINDRWEFKILNYTSSLKNPTEIKFSKYNRSWSNYLYYGDDVNFPIIGILGMGGGYGKRLKFKATQEHGPQFTYNVTESGNLSMVIPFSIESGTFDVRIVKNGEQIWPSNGFYTIESACTVKANTDVEAGDKVSIQLYSSSRNVVSGFTDPVFSVSTEKLGNNSYEKVYSPLWERPFNGVADYAGDYAAPPASLFSFGYSNGSKVTEMNSFDSAKGNYLYHTDYPDSGFKFSNDDLTYTISSKDSGMAITFTAPENGKYDFSTALKGVSGVGAAEFKVLKGSETVFTSSFNVYEGYTLDFPAQLLELSMGETVKLIFTAIPETSDPIVVNFGTPAVYHFVNATLIGSETFDIYTPDCFTAFEKQAVSTRLYAQNRFEYLLKGADNSETIPNVYNTAEKSVTANGTGFKLSDTGALTVDVKDTAYTHIVKFIAPKDINGKIQFTLSSDVSAEVILTNNGEQIGTYTATATETPISVDATLSKGDKMEWQVKSPTVSEVNLGILSITDVYHVTEYDETTVSYSALGGNPFGDEDYTGNYKRYDNELWLYDIAEIKDGAVDYIVPDEYTSIAPKYLYSTKSGTGYYFENILNATLKNSDSGKYGISLGFVSPRTDSFVFRTGLRVITEEATATLHARLIKNGETVWCGESESGWLSKTAVSGMDIDIPIQAIELTEGDNLRLEVYAEDITVNGADADTVKITLVSPEIFTEKSKNINRSDFSGTLTYPYNEFQYKDVVYSGEYIPMENRWNYEFATFGDDVTVFSPDYYNGNSIDLYSANTENSPHYKLSSNTFTLTPASENANGINLRYTSIVEGETIFQFVPKITAGADTANVKFRILHNGEVIWPTDTEEKWETLTKDSPMSAISDRLNLKLKLGDDVEVQLYAQPSDENAGNVTVYMYSFAMALNFKKEYNNTYSAAASNPTPVQLSHFWAYEYAMDPENPVWKRAASFGNQYYNANGLSYTGVSPGLPTIGITNIGSFKTTTAPYNAIPIISMTLTAPKDGFYKFGSNAATLYTRDSKPTKIRITLNGETVWPTDAEWRTISAHGVSVNDYNGVQVEMKTGDKLRFETTMDMTYEEFIADGSNRTRLRWPITVSYSEWAIVYTQTNDIFNMLTPEMYDFFKLLSQTNMIFDPNPTKITITEDKPKDENQDITSTPESDEIIADSDSEDSKWVEGTEDQIIVNKGKRRKLIKRYVTENFPVLIIVLIWVVAVLLVAAVIVIFILHKKGKINWFKKLKD